jgi:hypothetical protein
METVPHSYKARPLHLKEIIANKDKIQDLPTSDSGMKYPLGFKSYNNFTSQVQILLDELHKYDKRAVICFYGSSVQGFRFKKKSGKSFWFDHTSDYDLAVYSPKLYRLVRKNKADKDGHYPTPKSITEKTRTFPRKVNITFFEKIGTIVGTFITTLIVGPKMGTYLVGRNVITGQKYGSIKKVLETHGEL